MQDLAEYIERHQPDPNDEVRCWAKEFLAPSGSISAFELLVRLSQGIHHGFRYRRREVKGIQLPLETLRLGHGSCRDFAMLMIEAARSFGFAARFASGYLAVPLDDPQEATNGSTHAWAQIYLPGAGWIDFDPTNGSVGNIGLVIVATAPDPRHAIPLHDTFFGSPSDHLGMEVQVSVMSGTPTLIWAASQPARTPTIWPINVTDVERDVVRELRRPRASNRRESVDRHLAPTLPPEHGRRVRRSLS